MQINKITISGSQVQVLAVIAYDPLNIDSVCLFENDAFVCKGDQLKNLDTISTHQFIFVLPSAKFDGRTHAFVIKLNNSATSSGLFAIYLPFHWTPEDALLKFARAGMKATVSGIAGLRYQGLIDSIEKLNADKHHKEQSDLVSKLQRLHIAHAQLVRGSFERDQHFPMLSFESYATPTVSVVIPVHNKFHVTYHCLASLLVASNRIDFEVVLVDDGSSDKTRDILSVVSGLHYVRNEVAGGFLFACNRGVSYAKGDYIVLLNNDTEATAGWLDELVGVFDNYDSVGLVGSKLLYPNGELQEAGGIVWGSGNPWNYGRNANPYDPRYCYTRQVDYLSGACIMLPRHLWNDIGGFSEIYAPAYFEDTDLAFKVRDKGRKVVYAPLSQIVHYEGLSNGVGVSTGVKKYQEINRPKFKARWKHAFKNLGDEGQGVDLIKDRNLIRRALVLDAETPRPDIDAGSYAAIQEMRMLQALGYKCTFVAQNVAWMGRYTETLQRMGIECIYAPFALSMDEVIETRGTEFDLVYVTRYYIAKESIEKIRRFARKAKIVLMNADLHFLRELRAALHRNSDDALTKATETREDELAVMRKVDLVLTYTEVEKAVILSHNLASTKVARCPWVCATVSDVTPFHLRTDLAFLGGFQHPPNIEAVTWFVEHVLPGLKAVAPEIRLRIYGSNIPQTLVDLALAHPQLLIEGWVADVASVYTSCRVFIAPLQSGAGIKGKVIGALAHGLPCVLSTLAAEGIPIGDRVQAAIADKPEAWIERILEIYNSESAWSAMSKKALTFANKNYGFEKAVLDMQAALAVAGIHTEINNPTLVWRDRSN
jgi:GT2 family glycosyltransferase